MKFLTRLIALCLCLSLGALGEGYSYGVVSDPDGWTNLRQKASLDSPVVTRVDSGERVVITGRKAPFYDVMLLYPGKEVPEVFGFIHESRLVNKGKAIGAGIVHDPDGWSYLRKGPSRETASVGKVFPADGFFVVVAGPRDGWYWVHTRKGVTGYLHKSRVEWVIPRN